MVLKNPLNSTFFHWARTIGRQKRGRQCRSRNFLLSDSNLASTQRLGARTKRLRSFRISKLNKLCYVAFTNQNGVPKLVMNPDSHTHNRKFAQNSTETRKKPASNRSQGNGSRQNAITTPKGREIGHFLKRTPPQKPMAPSSSLLEDRVGRGCRRRAPRRMACRIRPKPRIWPHARVSTTWFCQLDIASPDALR